MNWIRTTIRKQAQFLLDNEQHAMLYAAVLALLPYTTWVSMVIIALVTLRKGWQKGLWLLVPAMAASFSLTLMSTSMVVAFANVLLLFVPGFLAASILRQTANWRAVAGLFLVQSFVGLFLVESNMPEFVMAQYKYLVSALQELQHESTFLSFINDKSGINQTVLAHYLLGLQALGIVFSACIPLITARALQSQLFYPGGFHKEMLSFRGNKIGLVVMMGMLFMAAQHNLLAISILPMLMCYFLLAGLSLSFNVLAKQASLWSLALVLVTIFLIPFIMLPVYVIVGSLDSIFNFRLYLPLGAGKAI